MNINDPTRKAYDPASAGEPIPDASQADPDGDYCRAREDPVSPFLYGDGYTCQTDVTGRMLVVCPSCRSKGILATPEPGSDWLAPPTFDFGVALRMLKAGRTVRRIHWTGVLEQTLTSRGSLGLWLVASGDHSFAGREVAWKQSPEDLFAEDWEIVL